MRPQDRQALADTHAEEGGGIMPYVDGNPTLTEQLEEDERRRFYTQDLVDEANELAAQLGTVVKLCEAYYCGDAKTFANPDNDELLTATYEVRAFARAVLQWANHKAETP